MKAFVDTNVVLDVILKRFPFYQNSLAVFQLVDQGHIRACLSATTMTTMKTIADALALRWKDFEDAVQYIAASENNADYIVTRNTQDFTSSHIPAVTPEQFIRIIADTEQ